jgi:hypothetical protein
MKSLDSNVNEYLSALRLVDPAAAARVEEAIQAHRAAAVRADFAFADLAEAARRMVLDLDQDHSAVEHIEQAIAANPIPGLAAPARCDAAIAFVARTVDPEYEASGRGPKEVMTDAPLSADGIRQGWNEDSHLAGLAQLRSALKSARATRSPEL